MKCSVRHLRMKVQQSTRVLGELIQQTIDSKTMYLFNVLLCYVILLFLHERDDPFSRGRYEWGTFTMHSLRAAQLDACCSKGSRIRCMCGGQELHLVHVVFKVFLAFYHSGGCTTVRADKEFKCKQV